MALPKKYSYLAQELGPKMLLAALIEYGTLEGPGTQNNPKIINWAAEVGENLANVYKADSIPWCFGAGTMIETKDGLKPIENITTEDLVLSHDGTYNKVIQILHREKETLKLNALGIVDTITTADHPYLVRKRETDKYVKGKRIRSFSEKEWVKVSDIQRGDMIAIPLFSESNKEIINTVTKNEAFLLGIYIAEGTGRSRVIGNTQNRIRANSPSVSLNIGKHERIDVESFMKKAGIQKFTITERRTCTQIEIRDKDFVIKCFKFGRIALEKSIPNEVFSWDFDTREKLLDGYVYGDGCQATEERIDTCTISKKLALSVAKLARSLNLNPTIRTDYRAGKHIIEERIVNIKDRYIVQWYNKTSRPQYFRDEQYLWVPVRSITSTEKLEKVYDLTVENTHSFIANGAVVHNCGLFMAVIAKRAGKEVPKDPLWALNWGTFGTHIEKDQAMLGDILVFVRNGGGHVGIYVGESKGTLHVLGGNTGDQVKIAEISKDRLYAVRRPIYSIAQPNNVRKIFINASGVVSSNEA